MKKTVTIDGIEQPVVVTRRRGTRSIRVSITSTGQPRLSIPYGVSESKAIQFLLSKQQWVNAQLKPPAMLRNGQRVGKSHTLHVEQTAASRPHTKVTAVDVHIKLPQGVEASSPRAQVTIKRACEKALTMEATAILPQRVSQLSKEHGIDYRSVTVKKLRSRWGSCDQKGNLTLTCYLMQLDWSLIDYVICHELAHTQHHNHSRAFWNLVATLVPDYKNLRKQLKSYPTDVMPAQNLLK